MNLSLVIEKASKFDQACNSQYSSVLAADLDLSSGQQCSRDERSGQ